MNRITLASLVFLVLLLSCSPQSEPTEKDKSTTAHDQKMKWWRDARFGLFIHWGLYADPAGEWKGKRIPGLSEWIMNDAQIPVKEYEQLAKTFDPKKFDADEWVKLAKYAGMKYIVITAKHHDGFALFKSEASSYNIVDATPFGRDPLKELSEACKKYDIKLGVYYSQTQDWHEPGGAFRNWNKGAPHWDPELGKAAFMEYIEEKAVPQVKELLENYDIDILWWDTPWGMTEEAANELQKVVDNYPALLTNNRLYFPWPGDFSTPEQHVPPTGLDYDWEVCMTLNTSWGYKWYDEKWKSPKELIQMLADIASKGGNLLLNVGPTAEGTFPEASVERLKAIGNWMQLNGESIYGTTASPFFKLPWGRCTQKDVRGATNLYFHVFDWPKDGLLTIPGLRANVRDIYLLANKNQHFAWKFEDGNLNIHAPSVIFDENNTVIVVKTRGKIDVTSNQPQLKNGSVLLPADFADIYNHEYGNQAAVKGSGTKSVITNWIDNNVRLEWMFHTTEPGNYRLEALIRSEQENAIAASIDDSNVKATIPATGERFEVVKLGSIGIEKAGDKVISLSPNPENWNGLELMYLELIKE